MILVFLRAEGLRSWFRRGASACHGRWIDCAGEEGVVPVAERKAAEVSPALSVRRTLAPMCRPIVPQGGGRSQGPAGMAPAG
jgi:hypothetical protein